MIVVCVQIEHTHPQCKTEIKNTAKTDFSKYKKDLSDHDQQTGPPVLQPVLPVYQQGITFSRLIVTSIKYYWNLQM